MPATHYFHRETTHYFLLSFILAYPLLSSLNLQEYSIPARQFAKGENLSLAVAVQNVYAVRMQVPSQQSAGRALPIAPPTTAIDAKVYFDRGVTSLDNLDYNKAIIEFTEAIRLDANVVPAYVGRGNDYGNQGNLDEAIRDYCEAIRLDPNYALAYYNRGAVYQRKGKFSKAFSDYNEAIEEKNILNDLRSYRAATPRADFPHSTMTANAIFEW